MQNIDHVAWQTLIYKTSEDKTLRIVSPNIWNTQDPTVFGHYFDQYVDDVWQRYRTGHLTVDSQTAEGTVTCNVQGDVLKCDKGGLSYPKPTTADVLGCNTGPFAQTLPPASTLSKAVAARICAAFVRTTYKKPNGDNQPKPDPSTYYQETRTHHYSRIIHELESDGKGYTFPYDDVAPQGENPAGLLRASQPKSLTFWVGGKVF